MQTIEIGAGHVAFHANFKLSSLPYPKHSSRANYSKPETSLRKIRFQISIRGPAIWTNFVANTKEELKPSALLKSKVKIELLEF